MDILSFVHGPELWKTPSNLEFEINNGKPSTFLGARTAAV